MQDNFNPDEMNENVSDKEPLKDEINLEENHSELSEIDTLKQEIQKEKDQYIRLYAEFDNFKKRTAKERFDIFRTANSEVIISLLPVLDDFERAMKEIEKSEDNELYKGVLLIQNKLIETLRAKGLKPMEIAIGEDFDSDKMEAVTQIPAEDEMKGKVVDVLETGYLLNDKIIRFAKVVVGQ